MSIAELKLIIEKFGVVVDSWPPERLDEALDLLQHSTEAQDLFANATAEDDGLYPLLDRAAPASKRAL